MSTVHKLIEEIAAYKVNAPQGPDTYPVTQAQYDLIEHYLEMHGTCVGTRPREGGQVIMIYGIQLVVVDGPKLDEDILNTRETVE